MPDTRPKYKMNSLTSIRRKIGSGLRDLLTILFRHSAPGTIPVITYHSVDYSGSFMSVTPEKFRLHISWLKKNGYTFLRPEQYLHFLRHPELAPTKSVLLTFDDGYKNFIEYAAPILIEYKAHATMFVVSEMVGLHPTWFHRDQQHIRPFLVSYDYSESELYTLHQILDHPETMQLMDWDELGSLQSAGIDIESHGSNHRFLTHLETGELEQELLLSRATIGEKLKKEVSLVAYPYGDCNQKVSLATFSMGYSAGFIANYHLDFGMHPYCIGRHPVHGNTTPFHLQFCLSAAVDRYVQIRKQADTTH